MTILELSIKEKMLNFPQKILLILCGIPVYDSNLLKNYDILTGIEDECPLGWGALYWPLGGCYTYRQELAVLNLPCDGYNYVPRLLRLSHFFAIQSDGALERIFKNSF